MKVVFDTSVIVDIERKNESAIEIVKILIGKSADLIISIATLSEIHALTPKELRKKI